MTNDELYKVITQGTMKYIAMPKESSGFYLRKVCQDGAVTFLPVKMPEIEKIFVPISDEKVPDKVEEKVEENNENDLEYSKQLTELEELETLKNELISEKCKLRDLSKEEMDSKISKNKERIIKRINQVKKKIVELTLKKSKIDALYGKSCKNIIKEHHEIMKDDPDRLSSEFLVDITGCDCKKQEEKKEQPISCQQGTPLGDVPK